jgi:hypothetical protein
MVERRNPINDFLLIVDRGAGKPFRVSRTVKPSLESHSPALSAAKSALG